ncbi:outer membrane protein assembly factor BamB [Luteimonas sp. SX5]|uniref:Outer membrane protein assembly factor BamB n=1 Tax=Luteimonas galliterrae TaxID=2940486 RepID=A0ABT0MFF2_9GAMM|nr:outer membrane protein assembly factor BamB [Luteimonas galliterrae]MCL1633600.1 outer membrane protein assembly factor BamB [Luteimonas galliterrae]
MIQAQSQPGPTPKLVLVRRIAIAGLMVLALGGCNTIKGWFGGKKDKEAEPAELTDFTPSATVSKLWSVQAGKGEKRLGVRQRPAVADGRVYAAAVEGGVRAFDLRTGKSVWHYDSELPLSGGPGAGDGLVVVGTLEGDVIALDAATGAEKWKAKVSNEVISAPAVGNGLVLVHANDGRVSAFDAATGERRWFWTKELPVLTVRGNASPTVGPGYVFVGNDDGSVTALSMSDGSELWSQAVGQAEGRSELERMADVDGPAVLDGTTLYATSYKQQTLAIDAPSGRPLWTKDNGGVGGLGLGSDRLVVSDPGGTVWALDRSTGAAMWQQAALVRRNLSAPAVQGDYAVVGDFDGYLHWLKLSDGTLAARTRVGGEAVLAQPVVADGILIAQNIEGELTAFQVK